MKRKQISIEDFANDVVKEQLNRYQHAGEVAMKEIRNRIVDEWFGKYDSTSMKIATTYRSYKALMNDGSAKITVKSWVDVEKYNSGQNIQDWNERNHLGIDPIYLMEYVLNLQLEGGIIGLPEGSTIAGEDYSGRGWKDGRNLHFHNKYPLRSYMEKHDLWKKWEKIVKNNL